MSEIGDLFTSLGYPIAVTVVLFYYIFTEQKNFRKTVENNTLIMTKLLSFFERKTGEDFDGN